MTTYYSISNPSEFEAWIEKFKTSQAYIRPAKPTMSEAIKSPIMETLKKIHSIPIKRESIKKLELNLLYACFLASRAPAPDTDICAKIRDDLAAETAFRPKVLDAINTLFNYIESHPLSALKAIVQTDNQLARARLSATTQIAQQLNLLKNLLVDFKQGLMDFNADKDHPSLISSADFCYGPFEFDFDLNSEWKQKGTKKKDLGMNIIRTGLMFHLTFLFRYFTCETLPMTAPFFSGDILVLDGVRMFKEGRPHWNHVAALTNAVFGEKYSSRIVKDRLDDLYKPTPGSNLVKNPRFIGW